MNIIDFLDRIGHTKLGFQILHDCALGATKRRGGFTEVRFATNQVDPSDFVKEPRRVAIIVWMDFVEYQQALSNFIEEKTE